MTQWGQPPDKALGRSTRQFGGERVFRGPKIRKGRVQSLLNHGMPPGADWLGYDSVALAVIAIDIVLLCAAHLNPARGAKIPVISNDLARFATANCPI
jgi:hypothetical protein